MHLNNVYLLRSGNLPFSTKVFITMMLTEPSSFACVMPFYPHDFGDVEQISYPLVRNEIMSLQKRLQELNAWNGEEVIRFNPYTLNMQE